MKSSLSTLLTLLVLVVSCVTDGAARNCAKRDCSVTTDRHNITTRMALVPSSPEQLIKKRKKHHKHHHGPGQGQNQKTAHNNGHHKHKGNGWKALQQKSDQPFFPTKLGLAWGLDTDKLQHFEQQKVGMVYDWGASAWGAKVPDGARYCSMLWGWKTAEQFKQHVTDQPDAPENVDRCAFGPNEVNIGSQSQMDPGSACDLMRRYMMPLKDHGYKIGAPSTTQGDGGIQWMKEFRDTCPDVWQKIDWSTLHFYEVKFEWFTGWVNQWHEEFGKDIIITEMAAHSFGGSKQLDPEGVKQFSQQVADYVAKTPWILSVAWTGYDKSDDWVNKMVNGDGSPNDLFQTFASVITGQ